MKSSEGVFQFVRISFSILVVLLIFLGVYRLGEYSYEFGYKIFATTSVAESPGTDVVVIVREGMSMKDVAEYLEEKGLVEDAKVFLIQIKLSGIDSFLPGTYTLNTSMTAAEMGALMESGQEESTEEE